MSHYPCEPDVRRALILRHLRNLMVPLLWYGFFGFCIYYYAKRGNYTLDKTDVIAFVALFVIIFWPIFAGWVPRALHDGYLCGEVTKVEILHRERVTNRGVRSFSKKRQYRVGRFTVKTDKGRLLRRSIVEPSFIDVNYIKEGDRVEFYPGAAVCRKLNDENETDALCVVCGALDRRSGGTCLFCGHRFVK